MNNNFAITAHQLTKRFGDFTAVDAISFEVSKGEIFGFLGANNCRQDDGYADAVRTQQTHFRRRYSSWI